MKILIPLLVFLTVKGFQDDLYAQTSFLEDFQVNENAGHTNHENPALAALDNGDYILVWQDVRNGDQDIFVRRFSGSGMPLGAEFRANADNGTARQYQPIVAADSQGNFVVAWLDQRENYAFDVFAQRFAWDETPLGGNFKVNDDTMNFTHFDPAIAMSDTGNFVIAWQDGRQNGNPSLIMAQHYTANGVATGVNFQANVPGSSAYNPSVGMDGAGNFAIAWNTSDVWLQRYNVNGSPQGSAQRVNKVSSGNQSQADMAMNKSGEIVLSWLDFRDGPDLGKLYAKRYTPGGIPMGGNDYVIPVDSIVVNDTGVPLRSELSNRYHRLSAVFSIYCDKR